MKPLLSLCLIVLTGCKAEVSLHTKASGTPVQTTSQAAFTAWSPLADRFCTRRGEGKRPRSG